MFMRKILMIFILCLSVLFANAQIATEKSTALDNISFGITAGVSTPLDFNSVFPINPNVGLKVQKDFTPYFGVQAEGIAILNDNHFSDLKNTVKATNVGINGIFNLTNIFKGYNGTPRVFEIKTATGLGWMYAWNTSNNFLTAKTGLDLAFNIGKKRAHSIVITPAIYWNLNKFGDVRFDKHNSQLAINVSYIYHFKNSNGTHSFKTYDVGAMISEIDRLNGALSECEKKEPKVVEKVIVQEAPVTNAIVPRDENTWVVTFETGSSRLSIEDFFILNQIERTATVDIVATASPEGTAEFNQKLSEDRAKAVADHLSSRGVKINSAIGKGVDATTGRSAIVKVLK